MTDVSERASVVLLVLICTSLVTSPASDEGSNMCCHGFTKQLRQAAKEAVKSSLIHKKLTPVLHSRPANKKVSDETRHAATDNHTTNNTVTLTADCIVDSLPPTSIFLDVLVEEDPVWSHFQRRLNDARFQEYEMAFRSKLATKPLLRFKEKP